MGETILVSAVPDEDVPPERVLDAAAAVLGRVAPARVCTHWIDACAGLGEAELAVRLIVVLAGEESPAALERALAEELARRRLRSAVRVEPLERASSDTLRGLPLEPAPASVEARAARQGLRDEVRRLTRLVPGGRVTTLGAIGEWVGVDRLQVALMLDALGSERRLPWHRITDTRGRLDTLWRGLRLRAQTARLEAERVPVREAHVVGFARYFIDPQRL